MFNHSLLYDRFLSITIEKLPNNRIANPVHFLLSVFLLTCFISISFAVTFLVNWTWSAQNGSKLSQGNICYLPSSVDCTRDKRCDATMRKLEVWQAK